MRGSNQLLLTVSFNLLTSLTYIPLELDSLHFTAKMKRVASLSTSILVCLCVVI